jgi:hypothetical protein
VPTLALRAQLANELLGPRRQRRRDGALRIRTVDDGQQIRADAAVPGLQLIEPHVHAVIP